MGAGDTAASDIKRDRPDSGASRHGADGRSAGRSVSRVSPLEVEPELGVLLTEREVAEARRFALSATTLKRAANVMGLLSETDAFGAIVLDGLLLQGVHIGQRPSLRLVEPGNVVPITRGTQPLPVVTVSLQAATRSRLALLDRHFLLATQRWPQLGALTYRRAVESSELLAAQLAIAHLPRVDERLMALMWLLADTWGTSRPPASAYAFPLPMTP
jgi:CRP/FNR family transcriptional regulator, cyclic AMP receptor protein